MKKEKSDILGTSLTVILVITAIALTIVLALTQTLLNNRDSRYEIPDEHVLQFLSEFIPLRSVVEQQATLEKYFSCIDHTDATHLGVSQDLVDINAVLCQESSDARSFRVCSAKKNYLEFMLLGSDGEDLPCRIGMFYLLNNEGKISSYSIFRLLPVSRADSEWSARWL